MVVQRRWFAWLGVSLLVLTTALVLWALVRWAMSLAPLSLPSMKVPAPRDSDDELAISLAVLQAQGAFRNSMLSLISALVSAAVLGVGLILTAKSFLLTRSSHNAERFGRSVELVSDSRSIQLRIAGILSLGRLAEESELDRRVIVDYLATFIRGVTGRGPISGPMLPEDVLRAIEVLVPLARRRKFRDQRVDLNGCFLPGLVLANRNVWNLSLEGADLSGATLAGSKFHACSLVNASLQGADVSGSDLRACTGISQDQLARAHGTTDTKLPNGLVHPPSWG